MVLSLPRALRPSLSFPFFPRNVSHATPVLPRRPTPIPTPITMSPLSRRSFLKRTAFAGAALSFPSIIPASALGKDGTVAPSNRLQLVGIGLKAQGGGDMRQLMSKQGVQVIAVCDVDRRVLKS